MWVEERLKNYEPYNWSARLLFYNKLYISSFIEAMFRYHSASTTLLVSSVYTKIDKEKITPKICIRTASQGEKTRGYGAQCQLLVPKYIY